MIVYLVFATIASLVLFIAVGIPKWPCGTALGSCLASTSPAIYRNNMQSVGALLLIAAIILVVVIALLILSLFKEFSWISIVIAVLSFVAGLFSLAGMLVYEDKVFGTWSPFLGAIGMTLAIQLAGNMVASFVSAKLGKS